MKKCIVKGCRKHRAPQRRYCSAHRNKRERERNPVSYYYSVLKGNARRRGIPVELTVEEFREFCEKTGYLKGKGPNGENMTIDRIDGDKGYSKDNIQILTRSENSSKEFEDEFPDEKDVPF